MNCTVCNHSRCREIDLALMAGKTLRALKQQFGLSRSALHRHKNHLLDKVDQAKARTAKNLRLGYLFQLNAYNKAAAATVAAAQTEGNARLTLQAANSGARIITAMARFEVDLDRETTYRLLTAPEYVQPDCLLPDDPHILAGSRRTLAGSLTSACPEAAAADLFDPEDLAEYLQDALDSDICPPAARQLEFPDFLIQLTDLLPPAASGPRSTTSGKHPEPKRDKSGTKAGQTCPLPKNSQQDQIDILNKKRSATNAAKACPNGLPPANSALPDESSAPTPETENDLLPNPCPLTPAHRSSNPCSLVPDPCLLEPQTVFPAPLAEPPVANNSPEILDESLAAELAAYLKDFPPYARPAQDPDAYTTLPPDTNPSPSSLIPDPCPLKTDDPAAMFITGNRPASFPLAAAPAPPVSEELPGLSNSSGDELFLMTHGYPRNNPPKHIPNRHRDDDLRGFSLFREIKKYF